MSAARAQWSALPEDVGARIARIADSEVSSTLPQSGGFSAGLAERVLFASGRHLFVKAIADAGHEGTLALYEREAEVLRALPPAVPVPRLVEAFHESGWFVLVIEDIAGRHPERRADAADTLRVLEAMTELAAVRGDLSFPPLSGELAETAGSWHRLDEGGLIDTTTPWCAAHLALLKASASTVCAAVGGDRLVHADLRPDNTLIDDGGKVWFVDWPWAARGPGWFDALAYLLDLALASPAADVDRLLQHPLFADADPARIDAVLAAFAGTWFEKSRQPAPPGMSALRDFQRREAIAAAKWFARRVART